MYSGARAASARFNKRIIHLSHCVYEASAIIDDKYWQMLDRATPRPPSKHPARVIPAILYYRRPEGRGGAHPKIQNDISVVSFAAHCRRTSTPECCIAPESQSESQCINQAVYRCESGQQCPRLRGRGCISLSLVKGEQRFLTAALFPRRDRQYHNI